jgi:hypothetical protein
MHALGPNQALFANGGTGSTTFSIDSINGTSAALAVVCE